MCGLGTTAQLMYIQMFEYVTFMIVSLQGHHVFIFSINKKYFPLKANVWVVSVIWYAYMKTSKVTGLVCFLYLLSSILFSTEV